MALLADADPLNSLLYTLVGATAAGSSWLIAMGVRRRLKLNQRLRRANECLDALYAAKGEHTRRELALLYLDAVDSIPLAWLEDNHVDAVVESLRARKSSDGDSAPSASSEGEDPTPTVSVPTPEEYERQRHARLLEKQERLRRKPPRIRLRKK